MYVYYFYGHFAVLIPACFVLLSISHTSGESSSLQNTIAIGISKPSLTET